MSAFDNIAAGYDKLWTNTPAGRSQRNAVWQQIDPLFQAGEKIIDLGCGTGEDALHLHQRGVRVHGIDASYEMVETARQRGVEATVMSMENLGPFPEVFDGAISNFGAINCLRRISPLRNPLASAIKPGGHVAICLIGRFCLWETLWFAMRLQFGKASRRWRGKAHSKSLDVSVYYPSINHIASALSPQFKLIRVTGIGAAVPPSFVTRLSRSTISRCAALDRRIAHLPFFRALCDHRLLIFRRRT